jgi:hypothetical protein
MMDPQVYAATIWALVMATVASPLLFRWALGVYGRATPIVRSKSIGGVDPAMLLQASDTAGKGEGIDVHQGRGFRIRIASRHHVGVQRELLDCLHAADVDVLEAQVRPPRHESSLQEPMSLDHERPDPRTAYTALLCCLLRRLDAPRGCDGSLSLNQLSPSWTGALRQPPFDNGGGRVCRFVCGHRTRRKEGLR